MLFISLPFTVPGPCYLTLSHSLSLPLLFISPPCYLSLIHYLSPMLLIPLFHSLSSPLSISLYSSTLYFIRSFTFYLSPLSSLCSLFLTLHLPHLSSLCLLSSLFSLSSPHISLRFSLYLFLFLCSFVCLSVCLSLSLFSAPSPHFAFPM